MYSFEYDCVYQYCAMQPRRLRCYSSCCCVLELVRRRRNKYNNILVYVLPFMDFNGAAGLTY